MLSEIRLTAIEMGRMDATNQSSEEAVADFILANLASLSQRKNKKAFLVTAIQAYALLLQDAGVKVES